MILLLVYQTAHPITPTGNTVADEWRDHVWTRRGQGRKRVQDKDLVKSFSFIITFAELFVCLTPLGPKLNHNRHSHIGIKIKILF